MHKASLYFTLGRPTTQVTSVQGCADKQDWNADAHSVRPGSSQLKPNIAVARPPDPDRGRSPAVASQLLAQSLHQRCGELKRTKNARLTCSRWGRRWTPGATCHTWNDGATKHLHQVVRAEHRSCPWSSGSWPRAKIDDWPLTIERIWSR
jgi:hypothetical protein